MWGKFAAGVLLLECMLLCAIAPVVEGQIRKSVLEELLKRGIGVAENMASVNAGAAAAGVDGATVRSTAARLAEASSVAIYEDLGTQMAPHSTLVSYLQRVLWVLLGTVGLVLLVACGLVQSAHIHRARSQ